MKTFRFYVYRTWEQERAADEVWKAIKLGKLPALAKTYVKCTDCDRRAACYDHRLYSKPLDVHPVCHKCNKARGPAEDCIFRSKVSERKIKRSTYLKRRYERIDYSETFWFKRAKVAA